MSTVSMTKTLPLQTIQFSKKFSSMSKTFIFRANQFNISIKFSPIWSIDRTLSFATTLSQSEPSGDGNEGLLCISQSSKITETSPLDCLVSYPGYLLGES